MKKRIKRFITGLLAVMLVTAMIPADMVKAAEECSHTRTEIVNAKATTCTEDGYTGDEICSICKVVLNPGMVLKSSGHISYIDEEVAPTCSTAGLTGGFHCAVCNEVLTAQKTIPATGKHTYKNVKVDTRATTKKNGKITQKCTQCGKLNPKKVMIYYPKTIKLSKTRVTYNGKSRKPSVEIKDSKNKKISSKNYTVSYKNNQNPGTATVTVKFKNNYTGTVKKTFKILPKSTSVSKVSAKVEAIEVKWKKQTSQVSGYQLQYSASSKFKGAKTITIKSNKTTSKTISKLKAKQEYYIRVRTYKKIKVNGKYKNVYSDWSKSKTVITKRNVTLSADEIYNAQRVVALVNVERAKAGLKPLALDMEITAAAIIRAKEIEIYFSHTRPDGRDCFTVLDENKIPNKWAGENIAMGQRSPEEVMNDWMNSPGHRANILRPQFTRIGVGYYLGAKGRKCWVQLFTS